MKEHKNHTVHSERILWMVSAVEDFGVSHLNPKVPYVAIALVDSKLGEEGRNDLFDWLSRQLSGLGSFAEAAQLLKPASSAMVDKSSDVCKAT
ncbi:unnamed protein product [Trifolium pratense]|uniref:Uncharacterized protein n=1 Tax=Trifolium pratense TaxID=57577 RepID=A0ACB0K872_TRIPR|nr:unnamed protein product [Trifolium pratense]